MKYSEHDKQISGLYILAIIQGIINLAIISLLFCKIESNKHSLIKFIYFPLANNTP